MAGKTVAAPTAPENVELDTTDVAGTIDDLTTLEQVVEKGLDSFIAVGESLAEIADRKLYKLKGFGTFENYCSVEWNLDRSFAYKQIRASQVVKLIAQHTDVVPRNEGQARELTVLKTKDGGFDEDKVIEAWTRSLDAATEKGQMMPTAADIHAVVVEMKREDQLAGGVEEEEAEEDPAKAHARAVKQFPKVWSKFEDQFGVLEDLPMRSISVVVETDEDAGIFEGDVDALVERINEWHSNFTTDIQAYRDQRAAARARIAAAKAGKAKVAGGTNGRSLQQASEAETENVTV